MAMDGNTLADEVLAAMGGEVSDVRREAFRKLCGAIVAHIRTDAQISGVCTGLTSPPGGGPVTGTAVLPPGSIT